MMAILNSGLLAIVGIIITLFVTWIIVSIPLYFAAKVVSSKHTTFGKAMVAAIVAPLLTLLIYYIVTIGLALFLGPLAIAVGLIIAILVLSYVYASFFRTGMLGGFAIAVLATIITYIIAFVVLAALVGLLGISASTFPHGFGGPFF